MFTVEMSTSGDPATWEPCFTLPNVKIPSVAYLGFSAETGELTDNHDIISVVTNNLYQPEGSRSNPSDQGGRKKSRSQKQGGGWGWFFFKFILFGLVVAGGYIGFTAYRSQQNRSRF